jgi:hypothetical protein
MDIVFPFDVCAANSRHDLYSNTADKLVNVGLVSCGDNPHSSARRNSLGLLIEVIWV